MKNQKYIWIQRRKRMSAIVEMKSADDWISRGYNILNCVMLLINVAVTILYTFDRMELQYGGVLLAIEAVTVAFFAVDYVLRVWTAPALYPNKTEFRAIRKYVFSLTGIVDLLSFLPYYLPIFFRSHDLLLILFLHY